MYQLQHTVKNNTIAELYQLHGRSIFMYLRLHTASREDAEDILVEVFLAALEQGILERVPTQHHQAWLWRVTENKLVDLHRRNQRRPTLTLDYAQDKSLSVEGEIPEKALLRKEEVALLHQQVQQLPSLQRQVIYLRFVQGLRSAEIGQILGLRAGTVRMHLSRTLNRLKKFYQSK